MLTDLDELPDYEEGWGYYYGGPRGAPVDENGDPVFYTAPATWDDGQERRRALAVAARHPHGLAAGQAARTSCASGPSFCRSQFGVQTMADYGWWFARQTDDADVAKSTFDLHTLGEDETIARLATGIKRFKLPEEHNYIALLKQIAEEADGRATSGQSALADAGRGVRGPPAVPASGGAVEAARRGVAGRRRTTASGCEQIIEQLGAVRAVVTQPARRGATLDYRFRNGKRVEFTARPVKMRGAARRHQGVPRRAIRGGSIGSSMNIDQLGYRLVVEGQEKYLGAGDGAVVARPRAAARPLRSPRDRDHAAAAGRGVPGDREDGRRQRARHRRVARRHGDRQEAAGRQGAVLRGRRGDGQAARRR